MIPVHILRPPALVGLGVIVHILVGDVVVVNFLLVVPHASVLQAPQGIERIAGLVAIDHVSFLVFHGHHFLFAAYVFDHLAVM